MTDLGTSVPSIPGDLHHNAAPATFRPADLGYAGDVYVYDVNRAVGRLAAVAATYSDTITDTAYYVVAPIGKSGMAFLGDAGKFASVGRQRISTWSDDGTLTPPVRR